MKEDPDSQKEIYVAVAEPPSAWAQAHRKLQVIQQR